MRWVARGSLSMADTRRSRSSFSRPSITDVSVASADRLKPAARILVTALVDVLPQEKLSGAEVHALVEAIQEADPSGAALGHIRAIAGASYSDMSEAARPDANGMAQRERPKSLIVNTARRRSTIELEGFEPEASKAIEPQRLPRDDAARRALSWDGRLSAKRPGYGVSDLMHLLRKAVGGADEYVVESLFSKFDVDSNGTLDFQEFAKAIQFVLRQARAARARIRGARARARGARARRAFPSPRPDHPEPPLHRCCPLMR